MARGNTRRRELIRSLNLQGQAEGLSTKVLLERKAAADAAAAPKRRRRKTTEES